MVALLSGGLDSAVALALAFERLKPVSALFLDYNQLAASREEASAGSVAERFGLPLDIVRLPWFGEISSSKLIAGKGEPAVTESGGVGSAAGSGPGDVWVENRNGIFINIAAAYACGKGCSAVVVGFNGEEAGIFPDNSEDYLRRINRSLELGTRNRVRVESPTVSMTKREIVEEGLRLGIPWSFIWSCYEGGEFMCGACQSCRFLRGAVVGTRAEDLVRFAKEES